MPRGDLRGEAGVVTSPNATTLAGVTPTAAGLALLDDATAADQRTTLGLGSIATQAANNVSISGGSITGIAALGVAAGGTGGGTPAAARDGVIWASSGALNPASPYTVAAGVWRITATGSLTVNLPALSTFANTQPITVFNDSASSITVTFDPDGTDTIDGGSAGASAAYTVTPRGTVGALKTGATTWGSVQPGRAAVGRIVVDVSGGVLRHYGQAYIGGGWVTVTAISTTFSTGDPESLGATFSGTTLSWSVGTAVIATSFATEAQYWAVDLSTYSFDGTTPRALSWVLATDGITVTSGGINDYAYIQAALTDGAVPGTWARAIGVRDRTSSAPSAFVWNSGDLSPSISTSASGTTITGATSTLWVPLTTIINGNLMSLNTSEAPVNAASIATAPGVTSGAPDWLVIAVGIANASRATSIANPRVYLYV